jgi:putative lipoprotein
MRFRNAEPFGVTPLAQTEPVLIVTALVTRAEPSSSEPEARPADLPLLNITWQATRIGETPVPPGVDVTLLIEDDMRAGGSGGCNSFFSQATIADDSFMIGEVARTQRSCFYERNTLEKSYFDALRAAVAWTMDDSRLTLLDGAGKPVVVFDR